ncbi:hypothetical protein N7G274_007872 [Stereocaulon virgatum]|uniref:Uncharacterized protein n=1 Tax=Stereocaulon virgatum TaxID=373712 RepID=A0ABR4A168_9LECA
MLICDIGTLERKAFGVDADQIPDFWGCPDGVRSMTMHDTLILSYFTLESHDCHPQRFFAKAYAFRVYSVSKFERHNFSVYLFLDERMGLEVRICLALKLAWLDGHIKEPQYMLNRVDNLFNKEVQSHQQHTASKARISMATLLAIHQGGKYYFKRRKACHATLVDRYAALLLLFLLG